MLYSETTDLVHEPYMSLLSPWLICKVPPDCHSPFLPGHHDQQGSIAKARVWWDPSDIPMAPQNHLRFWESQSVLRHPALLQQLLWAAFTGGTWLHSWAPVPIMSVLWFLSKVLPGKQTQMVHALPQITTSWEPSPQTCVTVRYISSSNHWSSQRTQVCFLRPRIWVIVYDFSIHPRMHWKFPRVSESPKRMILWS